ncbi:MAG: hypothetical protein ACWGQW_02280 [bacterium]
MTHSEDLRNMIEKALNIHDMGDVSRASFEGILELLRECDDRDLELHTLKLLIMFTGLLRASSSVVGKDAHTLLDAVPMPDLG